MKIQTNAGDVELTAEMVCRGMVFQSDLWTSSIVPGGVLTMVRRRDDGGGWFTNAEVYCDPIYAPHFLGCDPMLASRADCERFGVYGDAGAHGFARMRGGGAVDLKRAGVRGMVTGNKSWRAVNGGILRAWAEDEGFIGLDARHASPEDVRRLCCCAEDSERLATHRCTLAIGDHDTHEDLATGAKWPAKPAPDKYRIPTATGKDLDTLGELICGEGRRDAQRRDTPRAVRFVRLRDPMAKASNGIRVYANGWTTGVTTSAEEFNSLDAPACGECGEAIGHLSTCGKARLRGRSMRETHPACGDCGGVTEHLDVCPVIVKAEKMKRQQREAPLVALVAAVPEGLDPVGWRAAVLAVVESCKASQHVPVAAWKEAECEAHLHAFAERGEVPEDVEWGWGINSYAAVAAYRRATTSHKPPPPERKRRPGLPVDDGRDD